MYQAGDLIIYGGAGVCEVTGLTRPDFSEGDRLYYSLSPCYSTETIYAPIDSPMLVRRVITREQADALICRIPSIEAAELPAADHRAIAEHYEASLRTHDCDELLRLIKAVYRRTRRSIENGRKPGQTDQRYLKRAETQLFGELAVALGIEPSEVPHYIERAVGIQTLD